MVHCYNEMSWFIKFNYTVKDRKNERKAEGCSLFFQTRTIVEWRQATVMTKVDPGFEPGLFVQKIGALPLGPDLMNHCEENKTT